MGFSNTFMPYLLDLFFLMFQSVLIFLTINKLWPKRSDKHVVSSISLTGSAFTTLNYGFALLTSITALEYTEIYLFGINFIDSLFYTMVAVGFWLMTPLHESFSNKCFKLWKRELIQLFRTVKMLFTNINQRRYFIEVLMRTAWIDGELHRKEVALLKRMFASSDMDFDEKELYGYREAEITARYEKIRQAIDHFFGSNPTEKQAVDLRDHVTALVKTDLKISKEEELLLCELNRRFKLYLLDFSGDETNAHQLLLVPTEHLTETKIKQKFKNLQSFDYFGINVFVIDTLYNEDYAEELASLYREQGLPVYVSHPWEAKEQKKEEVF